MSRQIDITTDLSLDSQSLTALAYASEGTFLGRGKVKDGRAKFTGIPPAALKRARVFVLPEPKAGIDFERMPLAKVGDLATFEPRLNFTDRGELTLSPIPDQLAPRWFWKKCCVRGRITNRILVAGRLQSFPVCDATVHICEVDRIRLWIDRIPLDLLNKLRFGLLDRIEPRIKVPEVLPRFRDVVDLRLPRPAPSATIDRMRPVLQPRIEPDKQRLLAIRQELPRLPEIDFRRLLVRDYLILRPYFCHFPYLWPYLYRCDEVAVAKTDQNGRYEACFLHQETAPDVYVWITYPFADGEKTVYRPPLVCYTRWDYPCNSDIDVQLHDSRIRPSCGIPLTGAACAIRAIGHSVSPLLIEQNPSATTPVPGNTGFRTTGLANYATGALASYSPLLVDQHVRPYTAGFPLIAQFGEDLIAAGIHYFKVDYRRTHGPAMNQLINPADQTAGWTPLDPDALGRSYVWQEGFDFKYGTYVMGPVSVAGQELYKVPPFDPFLNGAEGTPPTTNTQARWTSYDRVRIANIDSTELAGDGLYEFRVRFFDTAGARAPLSASFFRVPDPADATSTMQAPAEYLRNVSGDHSFVLRLRIDNTATDCSIEGVTLDGNDDVMTDCGFVEYTHDQQLVGITFTAEHDQDFAVFGFNLERGRRLATGNHFTLGDTRGVVSGSTPAPTSTIPASVPTSGYTLGADGKYRNSLKVADLLNGCGTKAAFSEGLSVVGLHTDGHQAGNFYRKSVSNAFALATD